MGNSSSVPWQQVVLVSLNAGAQALLSAADVEAVSRSDRFYRKYRSMRKTSHSLAADDEIDFDSVDQNMLEVANEHFLLEYGYIYVPEVKPPLMVPGLMAFVMSANAVQKSNDPTAVSQFVKPFIKGSFQITGIEAQLLQKLVQLVVGLRGQGDRAMQVLPKRYNLTGTGSLGPNDKHTVGIDGIVVWTNFHANGIFYTMMKFIMVHYIERKPSLLHLSSTSVDAKELGSGCSVYRQYDQAGEGRVTISLVHSEMKASVIVRSRSREGIPKPDICVPVELDAATTSREVVFTAKPFEQMTVTNKPDSTAVLVRFEGDD